MRPRAESGNVLAMVVILMIVLLIFIPALIRWSMNESRWAVKDQKSTAAFNLAESGISRAVWSLKISTSAWSSALIGVPPVGFNFDRTYSDVEGGTYRVRITSTSTSNQVAIVAEGRDRMAQETRAVRAVYRNSTFPGAIITGGVLTHSGAFEAHWGPVLAHNNINISGNAATEYFPRKYSKQVVTGTGGQPRDTNGINPPNTDNTEWWSDYAVPDLPQLDFTTMRASAAANGTLNYYTSNGSSGSGKCIGWSGHGDCATATGSNTWAGDHLNRNHFFDSEHHALSRSNRIWYWDGDVILTGHFQGSGCHRLGLRGTIIVRGNLTIDSGDCYDFTGTVPSEAWREYTRIRTAQNDSTTANQYPADTGYQSNATTFNFGSQSWTGGPPSANTDVGIRGFIYAGGNFTLNDIADVNGVIWAVGNVTNNVTGERTLVFYDDSINVPVLSVVLTRQSWSETVPSSTPWP